MQQKKGWGEDIPASIRNGDWIYQSFSPEGKVNDKANLTSCYQCHLPFAKEQYLTNPAARPQRRIRCGHRGNNGPLIIVAVLLNARRGAGDPHTGAVVVLCVGYVSYLTSGLLKKLRLLPSRTLHLPSTNPKVSAPRQGILWQVPRSDVRVDACGAYLSDVE